MRLSQEADFGALARPVRGVTTHTTSAQNTEMDAVVDSLLRDLISAYPQRRFPADATSIHEPVRLLRDLATAIPPRKFYSRHSGW